MKVRWYKILTKNLTLITYCYIYEIATAIGKMAGYTYINIIFAIFGWQNFILPKIIHNKWDIFLGGY